ncbi:MAG: N-acetylmuramoyl-L-alanine amidase [Bacteroidetes bacterium]|jgi:N-acetylmuramoyl-L-alanine amidase|nr:N-acetylmuramoyl-L-alanine amidase [Bacteroidota bacterium]
MKINNHTLEADSNDYDISFEASPNISGELGSGLPDTIVIHYTAGASLNSSVSWLKNPAANASAHLVVGKNGKIVQLAPFNIKAWHAGRSTWKGRSGLNSYSIGIEIDNAGVLEKREDGYYTFFDAKIDNSKVVLARHKHQHEIKAWEAYTKEQIETVEAICLLLKSNYNIAEIVGHDDISPGRKVDPGPAYPLQKLKDKVIDGRNMDEPEQAFNRGQSGIVMADYLNIRSSAKIGAPTVTEPLPKGTKLRIDRTEGNWSYVKVDVEGWVYNKWLKMM